MGFIILLVEQLKLGLIYFIANATVIDAVDSDFEVFKADAKREIVDLVL